MLKPRETHLRDNHLAFYGHEFASEVGLREGIERFLRRRHMDICSEVSPGEWLWQDLVRQMKRSAFCLFETITRNQNAHIELGYALASGLRIALLITKEPQPVMGVLAHLPSDLAGLVQVRYSDPGEIEQKLESCIPSHWFSVTDRLSAQLLRSTLLDCAYLRCLLRLPPTQETTFSSLVAEARCHTSGSSNTALADFLRDYDEFLEVRSHAATAVGAPARQGSSADEVSRIDEFRICIHAPYREWLCRALGELDRNSGA